MHGMAHRPRDRSALEEHFAGGACVVASRGNRLHRRDGIFCCEVRTLLPFCMALIRDGWNRLSLYRGMAVRILAVIFQVVAI